MSNKMMYVATSTRENKNATISAEVQCSESAETDSVIAEMDD